jgi:hypothetical protein
MLRIPTARPYRVNPKVSAVDIKDLFRKAQQTLFNGAPKYYVHFGTMKKEDEGTFALDDPQTSPTNSYVNTPMGLYAYGLRMTEIRDMHNELENFHEQGSMTGTYNAVKRNRMAAVLEATDPEHMVVLNSEAHDEQAVTVDYPDRYDHVKEAHAAWRSKTKHEIETFRAARELAFRREINIIEYSKRLLAAGITSVYDYSRDIHPSEGNQAVFLTGGSFKIVGVHTAIGIVDALYALPDFKFKKRQWWASDGMPLSDYLKVT